MKKTIKDYQYKDKTVIIRCDLNVPIKNNEIEIGKLEVKMDSLLENLQNEYNMTYENALKSTIFAYTLYCRSGI